VSEWKEYQLGDLGTFFGGVTTIKREDYGFGTPFITYKNVYKNSRIDTSILERMNVKKNDIIKRNCLYGDIFFTASSETPDEVAMSSVLLDNISDLTFNGFCKRFRLHDFNTLIPEYARYLLRGEEFRNSAYEYANGDVRFNISQESLSKISINIPDLPTQTAIAGILSSLDDKIELNNKINQELENLAQTLFKQWFIDFEFPDENGEPYKSSGGEMVESELGEIPNGWEVGNLNQIARLVKNNIKPFENPDTLYFHYSLPEFDSGKIPSIDLGSTILSSKYEVSEHSILVSKLNPRIPRIWTIINPEPNSICSTEFQVLKPTNEVFFPFVNYLCKSEIYLSSLQSKVTGTSSSHQRVNPLDIINYEVVLPQIELFDKFFQSTYDFIGKIERNIQENIQLTNLRDTLLPKLISGELEVSQTQTTA
jgi:type I restriction enzyme S subunit